MLSIKVFCQSKALHFDLRMIESTLVMCQSYNVPYLGVRKGAKSVPEGRNRSYKGRLELYREDIPREYPNSMVPNLLCTKFTGYIKLKKHLVNLT